MISKNFSIRELNPRNFPLTNRLRANLFMLAENFLEPIREAVGKAVTVTSGYRTREHNGVIGGSKTSRHLYGLAADITWEDIDSSSVRHVAKTGKAYFIDEQYNYQFIWYPECKFVHIGLAYPGKPTEHLIHTGTSYLSLFTGKLRSRE